MPKNKPTVPATEPEASATSSGVTWEYRILTQRDNLFSGRFDSATITDVLNRLGTQGWRVVTVTSAGVNTLLGGNRDEIMIFLERRIKQTVPYATLSPASVDDDTRYTLEVGGKERGPFTVEQLRELLSGGHVERDAMVRIEGSDEVQPLSLVLK